MCRSFTYYWSIVKADGAIRKTCIFYVFVSHQKYLPVKINHSCLHKLISQRIQSKWTSCLLMCTKKVHFAKFFTPKVLHSSAFVLRALRTSGYLWMGEFVPAAFIGVVNVTAHSPLLSYFSSELLTSVTLFSVGRLAY